MSRSATVILLLSGCVMDTGFTTIDAPAIVADEPEPEPGAPLPDAPAQAVVEDPAAEDDCVDTSELVYLISRDDKGLYLFDPLDGDMDFLGELDCSPWGTPASMGVARNGRAYVRWSDQTVYEVRLSDLQCRETDYSDGLSGFGAFGMGYATHSADTWRDELYIANHNRLAKLDTATWSLQPLGGISSQAELTGTAAGQLWGFLPLESPAELVRLSKSQGHVLETIRLHGFPSAPDIDTFAFAAWGGDFYLFVRTYGLGSTTDVFRVSGNTLEIVIQDIGIDVVGAGVSTCAPTE